MVTQSMCDVMVFAGLTCSLVMVYIMKINIQPKHVML